MSIRTVKGLPSVNKLKEEGIQVFSSDETIKPLRPLSVIVVNLMPMKEVTEKQILRLLGNTPLPIDIEFIYMKSHSSKHVTQEYLDKYYKTFDDIKDRKFDGMIITGAPIEHLPYEEVTYYEELKEMTEWSETNVTNRLFICWGAQFALNHYFGIQKFMLPEKLFGIYRYKVDEPAHSILNGFNDFYNVPVSRYTQIDSEAIQKNDQLKILASHPEFGADIVITKDKKDLFVLGHLEYDRETLEDEYKRDIKSGKQIDIPDNYYLNDDSSKSPCLSWRSHANILYRNWVTELNQMVQ